MEKGLEGCREGESAPEEWVCQPWEVPQHRKRVWGPQCRTSPVCAHILAGGFSTPSCLRTSSAWAGTRGCRKGHHTVNQNTVALIPARPGSENWGLHFPGIGLGMFIRKQRGWCRLVTAHSNVWRGQAGNLRQRSRDSVQQKCGDPEGPCLV